jgi:hypothetical protein
MQKKIKIECTNCMFNQKNLFCNVSSDLEGQQTKYYHGSTPRWFKWVPIEKRKSCYISQRIEQYPDVWLKKGVRNG